MLFCVVEQFNPFEHLGIDLLSQLIQPLMLLRRETNRLSAIVLEQVSFQSHTFRMQSFDLPLLYAAKPIGQLLL